MNIRLKQAALAFVAFAMISGLQPAQAQTKVTIAVGGGACLC